MSSSSKKHWLLLILFFLIVFDAFVLYLDWRGSQGALTLAMLDVGQGDAFFIESPTGTQILFDGGPNGRILGELARAISPFDRRIDALVITNPDQDHIAGFSDVLKNYEIGAVFEPGTFNDSKVFQNLKDEIKRKNIPDILARKGMKLDIGGGAVIEILFPDRDVSYWAPNDGSVVARLSYGKTSIMFTGDATKKTEEIVLTRNPLPKIDSDILKTGHHGSRTSTSGNFVKAVSPAYALISSGKENKYGHPHQDVLDILTVFGAKILRTDTMGTIIFRCDIIAGCEIKNSKNS